MSLVVVCFDWQIVVVGSGWLSLWLVAVCFGSLSLDVVSFGWLLIVVVASGSFSLVLVGSGRLSFVVDCGCFFVFGRHFDCG